MFPYVFGLFLCGLRMLTMYSLIVSCVRHMDTMRQLLVSVAERWFDLVKLRLR